MYASWNGATAVTQWRVLAGAAVQTLARRDRPRGGFETTIALPERPPYLDVQALGAEGKVLGTSATIKPAPAA